nr:hypothetical protein [Geodermatophilus africanus]
MPRAPKTRATWPSSSGVPTRMAPCRSAVTRSMEPSRSAARPSRARTCRFTSFDTSTSVV